MDKKYERIIPTICIRTDGTIERIDYSNRSFFGEITPGIDHSLDMGDFFEEMLGVRSEVVGRGIGERNPLVEELFYRCHGRRWEILGDAVLYRNAVFSEEELGILERFLNHIRRDMIREADYAGEMESAYWESVYDETKANAIVVTPEKKLCLIHLDFHDPESLAVYFGKSDPEAYPIAVTHESIRELNRAIGESFEVACYYDKMSSYMEGPYNPFGVWMLQDDMVCGDLIFTGFNRKHERPLPLSKDQLTVMARLLQALILSR